jgi:hypothetical protein
MAEPPRKMDAEAIRAFFDEVEPGTNVVVWYEPDNGSEPQKLDLEYRKTTRSRHRFADPEDESGDGELDPNRVLYRHGKEEFWVKRITDADNRYKGHVICVEQQAELDAF